MKKEKKKHNSGGPDTRSRKPPVLPAGAYAALVTLLDYPVSTCAAERGFSGVKRLKTPLRSTTSEARLSFGNTPHTQVQECGY